MPTITSPTLTQVLATASFGLGTAEMVAPDLVASAAGVASTSRTRSVIRWLGAREVGHGIALVNSPTTVWTRVAGDVLDVALLAVGQWRRPTNRRRGLTSALGLAVIAGLDVAAVRKQDGR